MPSQSAVSWGLQFFLYGSIALSFPGVVDARFNQENSVQVVINSIGGSEAATLAGASIGTLLAGADACDKLTLADKVAALSGPGALDAAKRLVQAEKNFNPFVVDRPSVCDNPSLPATEGLRGIVPLIDPAVSGAAAVNDASAASLTTPVNQAGSQADLLRAIGFDTFTPQGGAGGGAAAPPANGGGNAGKDNAGKDNAGKGGAVNGSCPAVPPANNGGVKDIQSFTGNLGKAIEPIEFSGDNARPFLVGGSTFVNFGAAAARSCDRQFNGCANAANAGADFSVSDCSAQKDQCTAAQSSAPVKSFARRSVGRSARRRRHQHSRRQHQHNV